MISVIIPAYNVQRFIGPCLDSVLAQTGVTMEIIVVDDGSTDSTSDIISRYAAEHDCIIPLRQKHAGPSAVRNNALRHCHGNFIAMVDGDDLLAPGVLAKMLDTLLRNPDADAVFGRWKRFEGEFRADASVGRELIFMTGKEAAETMMYQKRHCDSVNPSACGKLYRRQVWQDVVFHEGMIYEDLHLLPQLCAGKISRVAIIDVVVYGYRRNENSILHTFSEKRMDVLKATSALCENFAADSSLYKAARSRHFSAAFNLWLLIKANKADMPSQLISCRAIVRRLAPEQIFRPKIRLKNRIGAILQYIPVIFNSSFICKSLLAK